MLFMKDQYIKLFVTLGTQKFPFDRLLRALDELVISGYYKREDILVQVKTLNYVPQYLNCIDIMPLHEFEEILGNAEIVLTHGGEYSIITCLKANKHFVIAPRLSKFGEHVDDNQLEISGIMEKKFGAMVITDMKDLKSILEKGKGSSTFEWVSDNERLIKSIRNNIF